MVRYQVLADGPQDHGCADHQQQEPDQPDNDVHQASHGYPSPSTLRTRSARPVPCAVSWLTFSRPRKVVLVVTVTVTFSWVPSTWTEPCRFPSVFAAARYRSAASVTADGSVSPPGEAARRPACTWAPPSTASPMNSMIPTAMTTT